MTHMRLYLTSPTKLNPYNKMTQDHFTGTFIQNVVDCSLAYQESKPE